MSEHSKIDRAAAKPASLLERAHAVFGLGQLGAGSVPGNLPPPTVRQRPAPPVRRNAASDAVHPAPHAEAPVPAPAQAAAAAPPVPQPKPVAFTGPLQNVPRDHLHAQGLIVPEAPVSALLEEFRIVKRELLADARSSDDPLARRILVCSPHSGEGKTYCATNLAIALAAERDIEVVLVDADVMRPSVTSRLGIAGGKGLMDALADPRLAPESLVIRTDIPGLFVLPAGSGNTLDAEYLSSEHTAEVLDRLTQGAPRRVLVFDTPPALAASPAAALASHVGQALLVVRAEETSRAALEDAQQLLSACADIKLLLNAARYSPSGRRFGKYGEAEQ
ncbi:MAG: P-loop NTPase [Porphyrobacter sp.]|jgi:Mrp family chromosome partitioning ATPase|nr:P-loop NTPase [Porphyrobacter sp.]